MTLFTILKNIGKTRHFKKIFKTNFVHKKFILLLNLTKNTNNTNITEHCTFNHFQKHKQNPALQAKFPNLLHSQKKSLYL